MKPVRDMLGRGEAVSLAEALRLLDEHLTVPANRSETVCLEEGLRRVLAGEVISPEDLPSHPRSTMDGYALRGSETFGATESMPAYMEVEGEVRMGEAPVRGPKPGACYRIATGGYIPPGTDAVVMLEHTVPVDHRMIEVTQPVAPGANVMSVGEDVHVGQTVLAAGHVLRPQDIGLLAGLGVSTVLVFPQVKVGIVSTGDEIVPWDRRPSPGKIRDINSVHLTALCKEAGAVPTHYGIAEDREEALTDVVSRAMTAEDVVVLSGSSSVGAQDLGERVLGSFGPPGVVVHGVRVKPGKPVIVAFANGKPLLGLPGHPVSAAVAFDLFVTRVVRTLSGATGQAFQGRRAIRARLMRNLNSSAGRRDFVRVEVRPSGSAWEAYPVLGKSGALSTMVRADGFIVIEESCQGFREGESVQVLLYEG